MHPIAFGVVLGITITFAARITEFDTDSSYHATLLVVIATYYVLFAYMSGEAIIEEILFASGFSAIALLGTYRWLPLIGIGLILQGIFDLVHPHLLSNPGVPAWWPFFCVGVDVVLGISVILLSYTGRVSLQDQNNN